MTYSFEHETSNNPSPRSKGKRKPKITVTYDRIGEPSYSELPKY